MSVGTETGLDVALPGLPVIVATLWDMAWWVDCCLGAWAVGFWVEDFCMLKALILAGTKETGIPTHNAASGQPLRRVDSSNSLVLRPDDARLTSFLDKSTADSKRYTGPSVLGGCCA